MDAASRLDSLLHEAVLAIVALAATGAASLLLFESFRPFAWGAPPVVLAILLWRHRASLRAQPSAPTLVVAALALALLAQATLLHHANVHIGRDEGVYAMQAWTFSLEERPGFEEPHRRTWIGVSDAEGYAGGAPLFPPAYATLLGVGFTWGGDLGSALVDGVLVALAALLLYAVARRLMPAWWAAGTVGFFSVFHGTLWFSRSHASESLLLVLVLAAASLLLSGRPWTGAVVVAATLLTRIDAVLYPASYGVAALLLRRSSETPRARVMACGAAALVLAVVVAWSVRINPAYVVSHLQVIPRALWGTIVPQATSGAGPAMAGAPQGPVYHLRRLIQWGIGPLLLLAASRFLLARPTRAEAALLLFGSPALAYVLEAAISPDLPFYWRRFYPGVLPLAILLGFAALAHARIPRTPAAPAVAAGLLVGVALVSAAPLWGFVEWSDIPAQLDALSASVPAGHSLLLPAGQPAGFVAYLELRAGTPSVYLRSVPPGLPPGSPMTLDNWLSFVPPQTAPLLASEVSPEVGARERISPYTSNERLEPQSSHALASTRLHRACDFLGAFYGQPGREEHAQCGTFPPTTVEPWSLTIHMYTVAETGAPPPSALFPAARV